MGGSTRQQHHGATVCWHDNDYVGGDDNGDNDDTDVVNDNDAVSQVNCIKTGYTSSENNALKMTNALMYN